MYFDHKGLQFIFYDEKEKVAVSVGAESGSCNCSCFKGIKSDAFYKMCINVFVFMTRAEQHYVFREIVLNLDGDRVLIPVFNISVYEKLRGFTVNSCVGIIIFFYLETYGCVVYYFV